MAQFYERFFPYRLIFQWLNQAPNPTTSFTHREIAFTLKSGAYLRYQSFATADAFRREVLRLNPSRFELGPVYTAEPRDRKLFDKSQFRPLRKELVFDIDLTDYDSVRRCCSGKSICIKCWQFITGAIKVLDTALRNDFGFKHILWVYSGRRGAHAWICDKRALVMDDSQRSVVASYLQLRGKNASSHTMIKRPLHPLLTTSLSIFQRTFKQDILLNQDLWATPKDAELLLSQLHNKALENELRTTWARDISDYGDGTIPSWKRWEDIDTVAQTLDKNTVNTKKLRDAKIDIILDTMYPRLDVEVSRHLNHLLKSPFCVHPDTGRVCVPIDISKVDDFDPFNVPTVTDLLRELDMHQGGSQDEGQNESQEEGSSTAPKTKMSDADKTSLGPYIKYFRDFTTKIVNENLHEKRQREASNSSKMDF